MDIVEFFQQSSGKWTSQRTSQRLATSQSEVGRAELVIELVDLADPAVQTLCLQAKVEVAQAKCAWKATWTGTMEKTNESRRGTTFLVAIGDSAEGSAGVLLRQHNSVTDATPGRYALGSDDALTLTMTGPDSIVQERIWFASENLRMRSSAVTYSDGATATSFCSEIRMGVTKPAQ